MDRLHLMNVFIAVADAGSFAAAARKQAMSPPAVTRAIAALEAHLGVKLLNRTTRHVRVTEAGQRYLDDARRVIAAADEADEAAAGLNATPRGQIVVTAPVMFGRLYVMPGIVDYLQRYPDTGVSAMFLDRVVNLLEEGVDVGIRIGELADSSFKALRVGQVGRLVCASPAYLAAHGTPQTPDELASHTLIAASGIGPTADWRFQHGNLTRHIRVAPRLTVSTNDAAITATVRGLGIARLMSYQIAPQLASGELVVLLRDFEPPRVPVHILHREGRNASAKIRSFVDLMAERLRADTFLNPASP